MVNIEKTFKERKEPDKEATSMNHETIDPICLNEKEDGDLYLNTRTISTNQKSPWFLMTG